MSDVPFLVIHDEVNLRIDAEGVWHNGEIRVEHPGALRMMGDRLQCAPDGREYYIEDKKGRLPVEVADWPFVAVGIRIVKDGIQLTLSDGSVETIDPDSLVIDKRNRILFPAKQGRLTAVGNSEVCQTVLVSLYEDPDLDCFCVVLNGKRLPLKPAKV